jgi:hypothetical protein
MHDFFLSILLIGTMLFYILNIYVLVISQYAKSEIQWKNSWKNINNHSNISKKFQQLKWIEFKMRHSNEKIIKS